MKANVTYKIRCLHGLCHEYFNRYKVSVSKKMRQFRNIYERKKLQVNDFTIISNTCIGGIICHDLNCQFLSPTINLYIRPNDFVKFCEKLDYYLGMDLEEIPYDKEIGYPVAKLGDILLYCKHYETYDSVKAAWEKRKKRINWEKIFIIMTDRDFIPPISINKEIVSCDESIIKRFDNLPFENKVCIVKNMEYGKKYQSCKVLYKGCDKNCVGIITNIISLTGKRMYQYVNEFDYIDFLNDGEIINEK